MTTTPSTTPLDATLEHVLRLLATARRTSTDARLADDVREVELTIHEVLDAPTDPEAVTDVTTAADALTAAEAALDDLPRDQRPMWLLPFRAELAILRRRSLT